MKRVVVTGMGAVSPFGFGVNVLWDSLLKKQNGIQKIKEFPASGEIVSIAGPLPLLEPQLYSDREPSDSSVMSYMMAAAEAEQQAGLDFTSMESTERVLVCIGDREEGFSDKIDLLTPEVMDSYREHSLDDKLLYKNIQKNPWFCSLREKSCRSFSNYYIQSRGIRGPQLSVATACASGNNAIGEAMLRIQRGRADMAVAGGAYNYSLSSMMGFTRLGALSDNPDPDTACRPFDKNRSGFIMGSGSGILILEELNHALKRGAVILGEVAGYGSYGDAYRATDPDPEAEGAVRTIQKALNSAGILPEEIAYINAHGTSTVMNDWTETRAIQKVFGTGAAVPPVSSTKSMTGHGIMAAGALEAVVCLKSLEMQVAHPTRNWTERDPKLDLDYIPGDPREFKGNYVLSNNFGFGGQNASIVFKRYE